MICRFFEDGQKLNVADLNEITVLVDRSETALTEVALNQWPSQLKGPPHLHEKKEQMFFIVSGAGLVRVGDQTFEVKPNDLVYVPAAAKHQTIATSAEPLRYLLFNAFADSDKEGHASFAEHVEKVKNTRKEQALAQSAGTGPPAAKAAPVAEPQYVGDVLSRLQPDAGNASQTVLLDNADTQRCRAMLVSAPASGKVGPYRLDDREQALFVLSGTGRVAIGHESGHAGRGYVAFVPRDATFAAEAAGERLTFLCLETIIDTP